MKTIDEILAIADLEERIKALKNRKTALPNLAELKAEWDPALHDVMDANKCKKRKVLVSEAKQDDEGNTIPAKYEEEEVNRIAIPFQQDIVNIHTSLTVGTPPELKFEANNEQEKVLYHIIETIAQNNKIKIVDKKLVRAWLAETEVAEYWYTVEEPAFWQKVKAKAEKKGLSYKGKEAKFRLKVKLFSPFLGDTLYPLFDSLDNLIAFSREYKVTEGEDEITYFQTITDKFVEVYRKKEEWERVEDESFIHTFEKLPVIYSRRKEGAIYKIVSPLIKRIEELLSNFAESIDHHFFPKTIITGDIEGIVSAERSQTVKLEQGAEITKLTWQQAPDNIKLELDTLFRQVSTRTQTRDISFENIKGMDFQSAKAFRYVFMGSHMAVEIHAEELELYLQRRYNFLIYAVGKVNTAYETASQTIEITPLIIPYIIDDVEEDMGIVRNKEGGEAIVRKNSMVRDKSIG